MFFVERPYNSKPYDFACLPRLHPIPRYLDSGFQKGRNWFFGGEKTHAKTIRIRNYWLKYDGNPYESNTRWWFQICSMFYVLLFGKMIQLDNHWVGSTHQLGIQGMWFWDLFIFSVAQNLQATFLPVDVGIFSQGIPNPSDLHSLASRAAWEASQVVEVLPLSADEKWSMFWHGVLYFLVINILYKDMYIYIYIYLISIYEIW